MLGRPQSGSIPSSLGSMLVSMATPHSSRATTRANVCCSSSFFSFTVQFNHHLHMGQSSLRCCHGDWRVTSLQGQIVRDSSTAHGVTPPRLESGLGVTSLRCWWFWRTPGPGSGPESGPGSGHGSGPGSGIPGRIAPRLHLCSC